MEALIFGANGQDGIYLQQLLLKKGINVTGVSRNFSSNEIIKGDVSDINLVEQLIKKLQPEYIFHLAANSTTRHEALFENHASISTGTLNILESVKNFSSHSKVFLSGSGLQFKNEGKPIKETDEFEPKDAYSVSRTQSVYAARYYQNFGLKIYVGYFFNHDSPLRTERHMTKKIAEAAQRFGNGINGKLEIGDISVIKEYGFAGDIVDGIWTLVNQDKIYEANIGTGKGYSIKDWLVLCFELVNKNWEDHIIIKKGFTSEYRQLVSDSSLIFSMGWKPDISFEQLAQMMMLK